MASRASLNKVLLIGNLTRDPELRYTPSGAAVCTFGLATNRTYTASDGTKREEAEFTKIVSWNKLAELCSQLLSKGRKIYVDGRLSTRTWETPDGQSRQTTEVVIDDMRILDSRRDFEGGIATEHVGEVMVAPKVPPVVLEEVGPVEDAAAQTSASTEAVVSDSRKTTGAKNKTKAPGSSQESQDPNLDDLPF